MEAYQTIREDHFPGGVRCECGVALMEGDPYTTRVEGFVGDVPLTTIICVECGLS